MAFDEGLAARIRALLAGRRGIEERRMFGGLAFLARGKMFCGIIGKDLMARVGPEACESALREPHVRPMDFTGKPLRGYVYVAEEGTRTKAALARWIERAAGFVAGLDPAPRRRPRRGSGKSARKLRK